jgi:hypothetical protein
MPARERRTVIPQPQAPLLAPNQVLGQRARLDADRLHFAAEAAQVLDDGIDLGLHLGLKADLAPVVHAADRD